MDNQHRKISGYRELTQREIDLVNEAKALEAQCLDLIKKVEDHLDDLPKEDAERKIGAQAYRWHAIGRTDIEKGFMSLVRSIAQPQPRSTES